MDLNTFKNKLNNIDIGNNKLIKDTDNSIKNIINKLLDITQNLSVKNKEYLSQINTLTQNNIIQTEIISTKEQEIVRLQQELQNLLAEKQNDIENAKRELTEALQQKTNNFNDLKSKYNTLEEKLSEFNEIKRRMTELTELLENERNQRLRQNGQKDERIRDLETQIEQLNKQDKTQIQSALTNQIEELRQELERLKRENILNVERLTAELEEIKREKQQQSNEKAGINLQKLELETQLSRLRTQKTELERLKERKQIADQEEKSRLETELNKLRTQKAELERLKEEKQGEYQEEKTRLETQINELKSKNPQLLTQINDISAKLRSLQQEKERKQMEDQEEKSRLQRELETLKNEKERKQREDKTEFERLKNQLGVLIKQKEELNINKQLTEQRKSDIERELILSKSNIAEIEKQLKALNNQKREREEKDEKQKRERMDLQSDFKTKMEIINKAREELLLLQEQKEKQYKQREEKLKKTEETKIGFSSKSREQILKDTEEFIKNIKINRENNINNITKMIGGNIVDIRKLIYELKIYINLVINNSVMLRLLSLPKDKLLGIEKDFNVNIKEYSGLLSATIYFVYTEIPEEILKLFKIKLNVVEYDKLKKLIEIDTEKYNEYCGSKCDTNNYIQNTTLMAYIFKIIKNITDLTTEYDNLINYIIFLTKKFIDMNETFNRFMNLVNEEMKNKLTTLHNENNSVITYLKIRADDGINKRFNLKYDLKKQIIAMNYTDEQIPYYILEEGKMKDIDYSKIPDYKRTYFYGPFTRIFTQEKNNKIIASEAIEITNKLVEEKPVMLIGYGASGSGKTSTLIYANYKNGRGENIVENGILIDILSNVNNKKLKKYTDMILEVFELSNYNVENPLEINENYHKTKTNTYDFIYKENKWVLAKESIDYNIGKLYNQQDEKKIQFTNRQDFGFILRELVENDRHIKPTTNNPVSSRSHIILLLKLKTAKESIDYTPLIVCDFAGVENKFDCDNIDILKALFKVGNNDIPYYTNEKLLKDIDLYNNGKCKFDTKEEHKKIEGKIPKKKLYFLSERANNYWYVYAYEKLINNIILTTNKKAEKNPEIDKNKIINEEIDKITEYNVLTKMKKNIAEIFIIPIELTNNYNKINYKYLESLLKDEKTLENKINKINEIIKIIKEFTGKEFKVITNEDPINKLKILNPKLDLLKILNLYYENNISPHNRNDFTSNFSYFFKVANPKDNISLKIDDDNGNSYLINYTKSQLITLYNIIIEILEDLKNEYLYLQTLKISCKCRVHEGKFINHSLEELRKDIIQLLKLKETGSITSPSFIDECLLSYCNPLSSNCFGSSLIKSSDKYGIIFDIINNEFETDKKLALVKKQEFNDNKLNEMVLCILNVVNLSKTVNNPPVSPYIDISELYTERNRLMNIEEIKDLNIQGDELHKKIPNLYSKSINENVFNNLRKNKLLEYLEEYNRIEIIRIIDNIINNNKSFNINYKDIMNEINKLIEYIELINSITTIGTMDYLDKISKLGRSYNICVKKNTDIYNKKSYFDDITSNYITKMNELLDTLSKKLIN